MRAIKWTLFNGAICACAWFGYVEQNGYCENVFAFVSSFVFIVRALSLFFHDRLKEKINGIQLPVPSFVSTMTRLFLVAICAAYGHLFFASAWVVSMISEALVYGEEK